VGDIGDLIQVKISSLASNNTSWMERYIQYRYYRSGGSDGKQHQLKMVFEPDAIQRAIDYDPLDAISTPADLIARSDLADIGGASTNPPIPAKDLKGFASRSFTYYTANVSTSSIATPWGTEDLQTKYGGTNADEYHGTSGHGRVKSETVNGACGGCGSSPEGGVKRTYFYMDLNGGSSADSSIVTHIVVEDTEDSTGAEFSRKLYGLNTQGVALREAFIENPLAGTLKVWCTSKKLDANRRVTESRWPSAHTSVNTNSELATFLNPSNVGNESTLSDSSGLIYVTEYVDSGGAIQSVATKVKQGETATGYYVSYTKYGDGTNDKPKWVEVETRSYGNRSRCNQHSTINLRAAGAWGIVEMGVFRGVGIGGRGQEVSRIRLGADWPWKCAWTASQR
jgi:hypothetical protein